MKNALVRIAIVVVCSALLVWAPVDAAAQTAGDKFGTVRFPTSGSAAVQPQFERAVAILHSFFYPESVKAFEAVVAADPDCAMAYWGLAISQRPNPLVPPWAAEGLKRGLDAIQKGKTLARTERERDWLTALEQAYAGYDSVPTRTRSERYEQAMEQLVRKYPDDKEAAIFYALALLEAVVKASREYAAKNFPGTTFAQEPHAQDFMAYAHLQLGQDREARRVVEEVAAITKFSGARNYGRDTGQTAPGARSRT